MTRGIFIVGNDCALSRAIETEASNRVEQFASAIIPNRLSGAPAANTQRNSPESTKRLPLSWNPSSPISARTLVIAAENRLDQINEAILICSPPTVRGSASDLSLSDIDILINDHIKGWLFLVRELALLFSSRKHGNANEPANLKFDGTKFQGTLALVYPDIINSGRDDTADVLGPSALASFRTLTNGLLAAAQSEPYLTMGFTTTDAGSEAAFAAFIFKSLDEINKRSNGKLHKFGKFHFFK